MLMRDITKGVYFNRKGEITKVQFFIIFLLLFVVLLILVLFFALKDYSKDSENTELKIDVSTLVKYPASFYVLGSEGDISKCNVHNRQNALTSCRITANVYAKNNDFCVKGLTEDDEKEIFIYSSNNNESLQVNAKDYCFILMSEMTKTDYCNNVKDMNARELCIFRSNL